ncbi:MAG: hypothetical protein ABEJ42_02410 [Halobacteriaceae archaeon]
MAEGEREVAAVRSEAEFQEALAALLAAAEENGVEIRGGWPVVAGDVGWDIEVSAVLRERVTEREANDAADGPDGRVTGR